MCDRRWLQTLSVLVVVGFGLVSASAALAVPGQLDTSFGQGGFVHPDLGATEVGRAMVLQPDGKIVVAGTRAGATSSSIVVARFLNPSGALDSTFGAQGFTTSNFSTADDGNALALAPGGDLLIAGSTTQAANSHLIVARLTPAGKLDLTYGANMSGAFIDPLGGEAGLSVVARPTGDVLVGGNSNNNLGVIDGTDPSGVKNVGFNSPAGPLTGSTTVNAVALQPDGELLQAGTYTPAGGTGVFYVTRLNVNSGSPVDSSFGTDGRAKFSFGGNAQLSAMVLQPDGRIVLVGSTTVGSTTDFAIARTLANGQPDTSFGQNGTASVTGGSESAQAVALQGDGKIIVAGVHSTAGGPEIEVVRLKSDGTLDSTFASGGKAIVPIGSSAFISAVAVQPDGKILLAGTAGSATAKDLLVVRLQGDSSGTGGSGGGGTGGGAGGGGGSGSGGAGSKGSGGKGAPRLSQLSLSSTSFSAAKRGGPIGTGKGAGTKVSYTLSISARTTFTILKSARGITNSRGRCVRRGRGHGGRPCTRLSSIGSFTHSDTAGANTFRFTGRIDGHKLPSQSYLLRAIPHANGKAGGARTVSFQIL